MDKGQKRDEAQELQAKVTKQWQNFANTTGREAYRDLLAYIDDQREMFRKYAEDRQMPHPNGDGTYITLDNEATASLLQNSRGLNIVRTYLLARVEPQVAQSKKTK